MNPSTEYPGLTIAEAAKECRCSKTTLRKAIADGVLHAVRFSPRVVRIPRRELERLFGASITVIRGGKR